MGANEELANLLCTLLLEGWLADTEFCRLRCTARSGMGLCLMITPRSSSLAEMLVAPAALLIGGCTALLLDLEGARGTAAALALAQQVMVVIRPLAPPRIPPPLVAPCGGRATHNSGREGTASSGPATVGRQHI
jgi:hypothetical protein